jgi:UDP-glucose 4-epimerase
MSERKIAVVTGGAGFIGSHMVDELRDQDYIVRAFDDLSGGRESNIAHRSDDPDFSLTVGDICDLAPDHPVFDGATHVFHFAGIGDIIPSIEWPTDYMRTNVQGTVHALECARHAGVEKFVYAASSSCYGLAEVPTREDHPINPQYPYALSKYLGEQAAFHWHQVYGLPVNAIRIFNAYGPRVRTTGAYGAVFGVFFKQKLEGVPLTVVGDGTQRRDFLYVTDVANAFRRAGETDVTGEIYNLGGGDPPSVNRLVELIGGGDISHLPKRPGEPETTWADITKIEEQLGWQPTVSFEDGVARMLEDIDKWRDAPLWTPETIATATKTWFEVLS